MKDRLDKIMVDTGLVKSRERAKGLDNGRKCSG